MFSFAGTPGRRFSDRYHRRQSRIARFLVGAAGAVLIVLGALLVLTPGPGLVVLLAGALLLAGESRAAARWLDAAELRVREVARRLRRR